MSFALPPSTHALLVLIDKHGPVTITDLLSLPDAEIRAVLADESLSLRSRIGALREASYVKGFKPSTHHLTEYECTDAGHRMAVGGPAAPLQVAGPRYRAPVGSDPYCGADLRTTAVRPGAMDAFALPSIEGGRPVPRRAPVLIASKCGGQLR
jgi:hypothetical protein